MSFSTLLSNIWEKITGFFQQEVVPEAIVIEKAFLAQFATPGGQLIFNAVTAFFTALTPGESVTDIKATGAKILSTLGTDELDLAGHDAEQVVLDAIRVHTSAANNAGTSAANPSPTTAPAADTDTSDEETETEGETDAENGTSASESPTDDTEGAETETGASGGENAASGA